MLDLWSLLTYYDCELVVFFIFFLVLVAMPLSHNHQIMRVMKNFGDVQSGIGY